MSPQIDRLNKRLALLLGVSRREADDLIQAKRVKVNGDLAVIGGRVAEGSVITVDDKPIASSVAFQYIAFHKPVGYVCSRRRQGEIPTIYELLPAELHALKPVGRLDKDSSGLLLLSNDGDFAQRMTHPRFVKVKRYEVSLETPLEPLHQQMIADFGVTLPDGASKLSLERQNDSRHDWVVTMSEGRNRQIRRTFAALGYDVSRLHRVVFGEFELGELASGQHQSFSLQA